MSVIEIKYGQYDPTAKQDEVCSTNDKQPWISDALIDLKYETSLVKNNMTCEPNFSILDGTMDEFPEIVDSYPVPPDGTVFGQDWGYMSDSISDENGEFSIPPTINIGFFSEAHSSNGITLQFYPFTENYASEVSVSWYSDYQGTVQIKSGIYTSSNNVMIITERVESFRNIKIEFLNTNFPQRYIKLWKIDFGILKTFEDEEIVDVKINETFSPLGDIVSANQLKFSVLTNMPVFSLVSGDRSDQALLKKQLMSVYKDNTLYGNFFLSSWDDTTGDDTIFSFMAFDALEVMSDYEFGGIMSNTGTGSGAQILNSYFGTTVQNIFIQCFPTNQISVDIDESLSGESIQLVGYMPIQDCRTALQTLCFGVGATIDTSRGSVVYIKPNIDVSEERTVDLDEIYQGNGKITLSPYYNGVRFLRKNYVGSTNKINVYSGTVPANDEIRIPLSQPAFNPILDSAISGISVWDDPITHNYVTINNSNSSQITVSVSAYTFGENDIVTAYSVPVETGEVEKICDFNVQIVGLGMEPDIMLNAYNYLQRRAIIQNQVVDVGQKVGEQTRMSTSGYPIVGQTEELDIDLRANKILEKVIGNVDDTDI